jgi:hypothetical protein
MLILGNSIATYCHCSKIEMMAPCAYVNYSSIETDILFEEQLKVISLSEFADPSSTLTAPTPSSSSNSNQPFSLAFPSLSSSVTRRPPLAVLIDLINYCVRVLSRLVDIQPAAVAAAAAVGNGASSIASRASPMGTPSSPSLAGIRHVMLYMLEIGLYLLLEHIQLYLTRLLALPHSSHPNDRHGNANASAGHHGTAGYGAVAGMGGGWRAGAAAMGMRPSFGLWPEERQPAAPATPEELEQVARAKLLDTYKERLTQLIGSLKYDTLLFPFSCYALLIQMNDMIANI